jgi:hypothetical protein
LLFEVFKLFVRYLIDLAEVLFLFFTFLLSQVVAGLELLAEPCKRLLSNLWVRLLHINFHKEVGRRRRQMAQEVKVASVFQIVRAWLHLHDWTSDLQRQRRINELISHFGLFLLCRDLLCQLALVIDHLKVEWMEEDVLATRRLVEVETIVIIFFNLGCLLTYYLLLCFLFTLLLQIHERRLFVITVKQISLLSCQLGFTVLNRLGYWRQ